MKKLTKGLLLSVVLGLLAAVWTFGASAAPAAPSVAQVELNTMPTGLATKGTGDSALDYQWFTLTNNGTETITLALSQTPQGDLYKVDNDAAGGLSYIGASVDEPTIQVAPGQMVKIAASAPAMRTTSLSIWEASNPADKKMLGGIGAYNLYFKYVDASDNSEIAGSVEMILPGRTLSKVPPASFEYNGDIYVPVDPKAHAITYNAAHTPTDRTITIGYKPLVEGPYSVYINCVNTANGALIKAPIEVPVPAVIRHGDGTKTYPSVQIKPEQMFSVKDVNGRVIVYRLDPDYPNGTLVHQYGATEKTYSFRYIEDTAIPGKAYLISVRYVDRATGLILMSRNETVIVDPEQVTTTTVDIPNEVTSSSARRYVKCAGEPSQIQHLSNNTTQTVYNVEYELDTTVPTTDYDITVIYKDAVSNTEVKRQTVPIPYLQTVSHIAEARFDITDPVTHVTTTYTLAVGENRSIVHAFDNMRRVYYINYNANGSNLMPSSVRIHYVENVANGELYSVTVNVPINDIMVHIAPDRYDHAGKTYVMSSGQSRLVTYNYGDLRTDYFVFYRLEGDEDPNAPNVTPGRTIIADAETIADELGGDPTEMANENIVNDPNNNIDIDDQYPDDLFDIPDDDTALADQGQGNKNAFPWVWTIYGSLVIVAGVAVLIAFDRNRAKGRRR